jgi:hypothetical protein
MLISNIDLTTAPSKPTDMTIHWKALEVHFLMVPIHELNITGTNLIPIILTVHVLYNSIRFLGNAFSEFFSKKPSFDP